MPELKPFLKQLISLPGLSAYEGPVREVIAEAWKPLVDDLTVSRMGSLHGLKRGKAAEPRPRIMLAAHMDAIGLMVTQITTGGFLRFTEVGGVDPRILPAMPVTVHTTRGANGAKDLPAIIGQPPDALLPPPQRGKPVKMENLVIDTGLEEEEVRRLVRVGDLVSFATLPLDLNGETLSGHSLDNRAAVAAVTICLEELQRVSHDWDVYAVATVQEEETLMGGFTSPWTIQPTMAVAIDVTHAKGPGASDWRTYPLGKGITLDWGPNTHPALFEEFKSVADGMELAYQVSVYGYGSGTDAMGMQLVGEGVPCMVVSIPLRYMHTPVETIALKDITRAGRLLAQFIAQLKTDFVEKLKFEE